MTQEAKKDKLELSEKVPLALALAAQSYVLFNWYLATVDGIGYAVDFVVAIAAGVALDLIVVTTTMGRREGRESRWSHAAAFGAFFCSALIALKVYGAASWLPEGWLHIAFPLEVWLYSQHLATPKRTLPAAEPVQEEPASITPELAAPVASTPVALPAPEPVLSQLDAVPCRNALLGCEYVGPQSGENAHQRFCKHKPEAVHANGHAKEEAL